MTYTTTATENGKMTSLMNRNNSDDETEERSMPVKNNREYRVFNAENFQSVTDESKPYTVRGYFTTFGERYDLGGGVFEVVDHHALDNADMSDVIMQYDHAGLVLARQRNSSLTVGVDEHGGWCEANLSGCRQSRDLYEAIVNGLVDRMSFGFTFARGGWQFDEETMTSTVTRIAKVFDVSAVSIPANPDTEIHARSYLDGVIEGRRRQQEMLSRARRRRIAAALELSLLR